MHFQLKKPFSFLPSSPAKGSARMQGKRFSRITGMVGGLALLFTPSCSLDDWDGGGEGAGGLSQNEIVLGLKNALEVGIDTAATRLGKQDGYWSNALIRVLLPEDVQAAFAYAETLEAAVNKHDPSGISWGIASLAFDFDSFQGLKQELWTSLNRAAETAAPRSVPVFRDAILSMTVHDGLGILRGDTVAATDYLRSKTFSPLTQAYSPLVDSALTQVKANQLWTRFSSQYNQLVEVYNESSFFITFRQTTGFNKNPQPMRTDLAAYTTEQALIGLFWAVGMEESRIRRDPVARVTRILREVFGSPEAGASLETGANP